MPPCLPTSPEGGDNSYDELVSDDSGRHNECENPNKELEFSPIKSDIPAHMPQAKNNKNLREEAADGSKTNGDNKKSTTFLKGVKGLKRTGPNNEPKDPSSSSDASIPQTPTPVRASFSSERKKPGISGTATRRGRPSNDTGSLKMGARRRVSEGDLPTGTAARGRKRGQLSEEADSLRRSTRVKTLPTAPKVNKTLKNVKGKGKPEARGTAKKTKADASTSPKRAAKIKFNDEFIVEKICDTRIDKKTGTIEYNIKWQGYESSENTWEPEKNLNCPKRIAEFRKSQS